MDNERIVTNRPLAGTRRRGADAESDLALEKDLLSDAKECAEHVMLVDLGRNDVGKVRAGGKFLKQACRSQQLCTARQHGMLYQACMIRQVHVWR